MVGVLGEPQARVEDDRGRVDPGGRRRPRRGRAARARRRRRRRRSAPGRPCGRCGRASAWRRTARRARRPRRHRRVGQAAADVVDDAGARGDGGLGAPRRAWCRCYRDPGGGQPGDRPAGPGASSSSSGTRCGPGPGRLAADVDEVGARPRQARPCVDRRVGVEELAAVGERVGGDVEDAHHDACGRATASAGRQAAAGRRLIDPGSAPSPRRGWPGRAAARARRW